MKSVDEKSKGLMEDNDWYLEGIVRTDYDSPKFCIEDLKMKKVKGADMTQYDLLSLAISIGYSDGFEKGLYSCAGGY